MSAPQHPHEPAILIGEESANDYTQTGLLIAPEPETLAPSPLPVEREIPEVPLDALAPPFKIGIVKNGISKKQLEAIKSQTDLNYGHLSTILSISRTSLINKKGDARFNPATSERIMRLADVLCYGREVFECRELFNSWIRIPCIALGGKSPLELLDTLYGMEEVKKELGRIEHGVF